MNGNGKRNSDDVMEHIEQVRQELREKPGSMRTVYFAFGWFTFQIIRRLDRANKATVSRPPFNAEYVLYLLLRREERDVVIGDLIEDYGKVLKRFNKRRADLWFYKQVVGSVLPLLRRALLRIGALVWLGRVLRRLVS